MFGPAGHLYVYLSYGMHFCCNVVVGKSGQGSAVLIRAVEPLIGKNLMTANRPGRSESELTNGPAKLCYALSIDNSLNGHDLSKQPLKLIIKPSLLPADIIKTTRIGLSRGQDVVGRFYLSGNKFVSRLAT